MKTSAYRLFYPLLVCCLLFICGCFSPPSEFDEARLIIIKNKYPNFNFSLIDEFYLKAKLQSNMPVSEEDLKDIYKTFFFDQATGSRRKTSYVYLNFYNKNSDFQYQLAFDFKMNAFVKNARDYY